MSLRSPSSITRAQAFNEKLCKTVARIQHTIGLSSPHFAELIGMHKKRYDKILNNKASFRIADLEALAEALGLNIGNLINGSIDYGTLGERFCGNLGAIPEKYNSIEQHFSRARGLQVIWQHLELYYDAEYAKQIFSRLQISSEIFRDPKAFVSPLIGVDLLAELCSDGFTGNQIRSIGTTTLLANSKDIGKLLRSCRTPKEIYTFIHEAFPPYYDRVFLYKLDRLTNDGCTVRVSPQEEAMDTFKNLNFGSRSICLFKQGVYISFLANIKNEFARIVESSCLFAGDKYCSYHISWN